MSVIDLYEQFGPIDIYLFDQLLRARITPDMRIFDAGCGSGRNLYYFLRNAFDVYGVDANAEAIMSVRALAAQWSPQLSPNNFRVESLESNTFPAAFADVVLSSAVLHFAADEAQFDGMLHGSWRVLKPGGVFFCRLASSIGMEHHMQPLAHRRFRLPDGSERFPVDESFLMQKSLELGGELLEPLKTTVVQDQRCMTTWVLRKKIATSYV